MIRSFNIKDKYAEILDELPNKSKIINEILSFFLENITEEDKEKLILSSHNKEKLHIILEDILVRGFDIRGSDTKEQEKEAVKETRKPKKEEHKERRDYSSWW